MKSTYLITGNLGYIGPVLAQYIKKSEPSSVIVGFDSGLFRDSVIATKSYFDPPFVDVQFYGDIRNSFQIEEVFSAFKIDHVIHLAAVSNDPMGKEFESVTNDINHTAAIETAKLAIQKQCKSFVFASSCSVYGKGSDIPRTEKDQINPLTAYAKSKIATEISLHNLLLQSGSDIQITCLRFATACGYSSRLRLDLVLNDFVATALSTGSINILSDGSPWRPLIDVEDMSKVLLWASQRTNGDNYEIFNSGGLFCNYQVSDLALNVAKFLGREIHVNLNSDAPRDDRSYQVNFEKLHRMIPDEYKPTMSLLSSIDKLVTHLASLPEFIHPDSRKHLIRLAVLRDLKDKKLINDMLYWN